jgi:hypothetical protein
MKKTHNIIKLAVISCILLVISVGIMSILIFREMTDITDKIASLNDLGYRRTLSIMASMKSKELLLMYDQPDC